MNIKQILTVNIIDESVSNSSGYAHKKFSCLLKDTPEVRKIHENNPKAIAEHLDGYRYNFGGRDFRLDVVDGGLLRYSGVLHTD